MSITLELANLFSSIYVILFMLLVIIYAVLDNKGLRNLAALNLVIYVFFRVVSRSLLNVPNAKIIWYIFWMLVSLLAMLSILKLIKSNPNIQKVGIPVAFLWLIDILLNFLRYFDRNFFETDYIKSLYATGQNAVVIMIVVYLFAPIALLLVKSLREKLETKH